MADKKISFQETLTLVRKNFTSKLPKSDVAYSIELETAVDVAASTYMMLAYNRQSYIILDEVLTAISNTNQNIDYQLIASGFMDDDIYKTVINAVGLIFSYDKATSLVNIVYLSGLKTSLNKKKTKLVSGLINLKDIIDDRTTDNIFVDNINENIKDDVDLNVAINKALKNHLELRNPSELNLKQKQIIRTIRINENELNIAKQNIVYIQEIIKSFSSSSKPNKTIEETQVENIVSLLLTYELLQKNLKYQVKLRKFDGCLLYDNEKFEGYFSYDDLSILSLVPKVNSMSTSSEVSAPYIIMANKNISFQETLALVRKNFSSTLPKSDVAYSIELETAVDVAASTYMMLAFTRQYYIILDEVLTAIRNTNKNIDYQLIASGFMDDDIYKTVINAVGLILSYDKATSLVNTVYLSGLKTSFQTKKQKLVSGLIDLKFIIDDRTTDNIIVDKLNETIKDDVDLNVAINKALKNHLELRTIDSKDILKQKQKQIIKTIRINENELNIAKQNLVYIQEIIKTFSSSASKPNKTIEETQVENITILLLTYELLQKNLKYQVKLRKFDGCLQYNNEAFEANFSYDDFSILSASSEDSGGLG